MTHQESRERRVKIRERLLTENDVRKVAEEFKVSVDIVYNSMTSDIRSKRVGSRVLSTSTYKILADLQNPKLTIGKIAKKHGVSKSLVSQIFIKAKDNGMILPERLAN